LLPDKRKASKRNGPWAMRRAFVFYGCKQIITYPKVSLVLASRLKAQAAARVFAAARL
jgi:hypothetical protein